MLELKTVLWNYLSLGVISLVSLAMAIASMAQTRAMHDPDPYYTDTSNALGGVCKF